MRRTRGFALGILAAVIAASSLTVTAAQDQAPAATFRTSADIVSVEATVRREKRPVTGLKITDFELLDNGVRAGDLGSQLRAAAHRRHRRPRRERERHGRGPRPVEAVHPAAQSAISAREIG